MKITIKDYRKNKFTDTSLQGWSTIYFNDIGLTVCDVSVIKKKDGSGLFYALPSKKVTDKETGEAKYLPVCAFFTSSEYKEFYESITTALQIYFREHEQEIKMQDTTFNAEPPTPSWQQNQPKAEAKKQQEPLPF